MLTIRGDGRTWQYTFSFSDDSSVFTMPAVVETEPGRFHFRNDRESLGVQCARDPREVPVGPCQIATVEGGRGFYSYEEAPRARDYPPDKSAR
jgi:hypothetical protein